MSDRTAGELLVVGDANLDLVLHGDVVPRFGQAEQILDAADLVLGGSAGIAASGAARLGVPTSLVAVVGDDAFGRVTLEALRANGVRTDAITVRAGMATGLSVILADAADRSILTNLGTIPEIGPSHVRAAIEARSPSHVHFASYFLTPSVAGELPEILDELARAGIRSSIDTNWDPAGQWTGLAPVLERVDVFLPNRAELRAVASVLGWPGEPGEEGDLECARRVAGLGPTVVVKDGANGAWSVDSSGTLERVPGLRVDVVDTTGAGDSFDAGYLAASMTGSADGRERLRWAVASGSGSVRGSGGTAAQVDREELHRLLDRR